MHNVGDHQIRINDVGVIDALKSMLCDNLDAASSWENRIMSGYGMSSYRDTPQLSSGRSSATHRFSASLQQCHSD